MFDEGERDKFGGGSFECGLDIGVIQAKDQKRATDIGDWLLLTKERERWQKLVAKTAAKKP